jgi:hypothetical protein
VQDFNGFDRGDGEINWQQKLHITALNMDCRLFLNCSILSEEVLTVAL